MKKTENQMLVIFGASGDLTARKLIPSLFNLYMADQLPKNYVVLGVSRSNLSDEAYRERVVYNSSFLTEKTKNIDEAKLKGFADKLYYEDIGDDYDTDYSNLRKRVESLKEKHNTSGNIIYYLSTPPTLYETIANRLSEVRMNTQNNGWKRLIVEKPFGYSLETAKKLNKGLHQYFKVTSKFCTVSLPR